MKIKNWQKHQHFKNRRPPWIKLHREILDQRDISLLSDCSFRVLIGLWLLASEDDKMQGNLPDVDEIVFRLRIEKSKVIKALSDLNCFLIQDDNNVISARYQLDDPETETETEKETERETKTETQLSRTSALDAFESFWLAYPKKTGKGAARKAWEKARPELSQVLAALSWQKLSAAWTKDKGAYIPNPATYLNQERWNDQPIDEGNINETHKQLHGKQTTADYIRKLARMDAEISAQTVCEIRGDLCRDLEN